MARINSLAKRILRTLPEHQGFWLKRSDHEVICVPRSLKELSTCLKDSDEMVVAYHMRGGSSDFVHWIEDAVGDNKLALKIEGLKAKNWLEMKRKIISAIDRRVREISK
ncbi:MAG: hypothetical protein KAT35_00830 [Candidatus Aenigmarchaeota archaeon]|nr:hypothetical protein [Candidatus Aenigmarchaeota archaeon]